MLGMTSWTLSASRQPKKDTHYETKILVQDPISF
jgi:hypothetical protein